MAPDKRREGMVIEIESGLKKDGTITARRGHLIIDNGAYTADSAFFSELAAMHVHGPYKTQSAYIDAHCVYTNHQPSGSVRAPTAPQACWALEQHTDELAAALGMDPVEFRRKNCIDTGDEGPTRQVYLPIGLHECIANAAEMSGYGQELPEDEAIGLAVGWWPTFGVPSGAYVKLNADGSGVIVTGAQECGTGSVMTLPMLAADELGMQPEDFTLVYQDTDAGPWDMGATGSQTLVNNGRAVVAAAKQVAEQLRQLAADQMEASPEDIELVDGFAQVKGSPDSRVAVADLAAAAHGGELLLGTGSGTPPAGPETDNPNCVGKLGMDAWSAPQVSCHAVRVKLDRDTGVVRVLEVSCSHDSGTIINEIGAEGQVEGGVMMGMGQALSEGTRYDDEGRQLNAALLEYKLQTMPDAPPITVKWVQTNASDGGPRGSKGVAEAPNVATAAAIANALSKLTGGPLRKLPDDARAHLGAHPRRWSRELHGQPHTLDEALAGRWPAEHADGRSRAAPTSSSPRARTSPLPGALWRSTASAASADLRSRRTGTLVLGALVNACGRSEGRAPGASNGWTGLADGSALVGSPATRHVGTIGGNVMNASPANETGRRSCSCSAPMRRVEPHNR